MASPSSSSSSGFTIEQYSSCTVPNHEPIPYYPYNHQRVSLMLYNVRSSRFNYRRPDLWNYEDEEHTATGDGRFLYTLRSQRISSEGENKGEFADDIRDEESITFTLDFYDLFLNKRISIDSIADFFGFGVLTGLRAIDKTTLCVFEYNKFFHAMRQYVILLDLPSQTAKCELYRTFTMNMLHSHSVPITSFSEGRAITLRQISNTGEYCGFVHPIDPFSTDPHICITPLLQQARTLLQQLSPFHLDIRMMLFVINEHAVGLMISSDYQSIFADVVAVLDISKSTSYLTDAIVSTGEVPQCLFQDGYGTWFDVRQLKQLNDRECIVMGGNPNDSVYAILNTRTLQFTKMSNFDYEDRENEYWFIDPWPSRHHTTGKNPRLISCIDRSGHFLVIDYLRDGQDVGPRRVVEERIRIVGHPMRVPTLTRLSTFAVQRSGLEWGHLLEIGERIGRED